MKVVVQLSLFLLLLLPAVLGQTLITVKESLTSTAITNGQTNDVPDVTRFPTQDPTMPSGVLDYVITNPDAASTYTVTVSSNDPTIFSVALTPDGTVTANGGTTQLTVTFESANSPGSYSAIITVTDSTGAMSPTTFTFTVYGQQMDTPPSDPELSVSGFSTGQTVRDSSTEFGMGNSIYANEVIDKIELPLLAGEGSDVQVSSVTFDNPDLVASPSAPFSVGAGSVLYLDINLADSTVVGEVATQVTISSDSIYDNPFTLTLYASVLHPLIVFDFTNPYTVKDSYTDFAASGPIYVDDSPPTLDFTINNPSLAALTVYGATFTPATHFSVVTDFSSPLVISGDSSDSVQVSMNTDTEFDDSAVLAFESDFDDVLVTIYGTVSVPVVDIYVFIDEGSPFYEPTGTITGEPGEANVLTVARTNQANVYSLEISNLEQTELVVTSIAFSNFDGSDTTVFSFVEGEFGPSFYGGELSVQTLTAGVYRALVEITSNDSSTPLFTLPIEVEVVDAICGDSAIEGAETCDDGNTNAGDGCSDECVLEVCGDGVVNNDPSLGEGTPNEYCDDGNVLPFDGCDSGCNVEPFFTCPEAGGACEQDCGDGILALNQQCDDGNEISGDGCSSGCNVEAGYLCTGSPSVCVLKCGSGTLEAGEFCDDGNRSNGDGCSSSCTIETGSACSGVPSVCSEACGDFVIGNGEECDDGNTDANDGCSATCTIEVGFECLSSPSDCTALCGNGELNAGETCDDGNTSAGDGCSASCLSEVGFACSGSPSSCEVLCGNGELTLGETCDDGNTVSGDGCSASCQVEAAFLCSGVPSVCSAGCGNGDGNVGEACDDGNLVNGDGCSSLCTIENGFDCSGFPSLCEVVCGNGELNAGELCDDGNRVSGDGCSDACVIEPGSKCDGVPSACLTTCGDGLLDLDEECDDGNKISEDGCSNQCIVEPGFLCAGVPTTCIRTCGNGEIQTNEECDDLNRLGGDGCGTGCAVEAGYTCEGVPSVCIFTCGNEELNTGEECDDGNAVDGDGCSGVCEVETGFTCNGTPSVCSATCGDGTLDSTETCDDGNGVAGDGCDADCTVELGYLCIGAPSLCAPVCGDGMIVAPETCDDDNDDAGDGCSSDCVVEDEWTCDVSVTPTKCHLCGNGRRETNYEACDDGNAVNGDGCSTSCTLEVGTGAGFTCDENPLGRTICSLCGDGDVAGNEACDDGNTDDDDGCASDCLSIDADYACVNPADGPSVCQTDLAILVANIVPRSGPNSENTDVTIYGSGLTGEVTCLYGDLTIVAEPQDTLATLQEFICQFPPPALERMAARQRQTGAGSNSWTEQEFRVTADGTAVPSQVDLKLYRYDPPVVSAVEPNFAIATKATQITFYGSHFVSETGVADAAGVFGDASTFGLGVVTVDSSTRMTVSTPVLSNTDTRVNLAVGVSQSLFNGVPYSVQWGVEDTTFSFVQCLGGSFVDETSETGCTECSPGTFSNPPEGEGALECSRCSTSSWQSEPASTSCEDCPTATINVGDRTSISDCMCRESFYDPTRSGGGVQCEPCPPGASCGGADLDPVALPGFWASVDDPFVFLSCDNPEACVGGPPETCGDSYAGRLCGECQPGFFKSGLFCKTCPENSELIIIAFVVAVLIICLLVLAVVGKGGAKAYGATLSLTTTYIQVLLLIASMNIDWPINKDSEVVRAVSFVFTLDVDILATECSQPEVKFYEKWALKVMLPFIFLAALIFLNGMALLFNGLLKLTGVYDRGMERRIAKEQGASVEALRQRVAQARAGNGNGSGLLDSSSASSSSSFHSSTSHSGLVVSESPGVTRSIRARSFARILVIKAKQTVRGLGEALTTPFMLRPAFRRSVNAFLTTLMLVFLPIVSASLSIFDCTEREDGRWSLDADPSELCFEDSWNQVAPIAAILSVFYGLGVPLGLFVYLMRNRHRVRSASFLAKFSSLYEKYKVHLPYWEVMFLFESLTISLMSQFATSFVEFQLICLVIVFFIAALVHMRVQPFAREATNSLRLALLLSQSLIALCGLLFKANSFPSEAAKDGIEVFVLVAIVASLVYVIWSVAQDLVSKRRLLTVSLEEDVEDFMARWMTPQGVFLVQEWLLTEERKYLDEQEEIYGRDMVVHGTSKVLEQFRSFSSALDEFRLFWLTAGKKDTSFSPTAVGVERLHTVVSNFSHGIWLKESLPLVAHWMAVSVDQHKSVDHAPHLVAFLAAMSSLRLHVDHERALSQGRFSRALARRLKTGQFAFKDENLFHATAETSDEDASHFSMHALEKASGLSMSSSDMSHSSSTLSNSSSVSNSTSSSAVLSGSATESESAADGGMATDDSTDGFRSVTHSETVHFHAGDGNPDQLVDRVAELIATPTAGLIRTPVSRFFWGASALVKEDGLGVSALERLQALSATAFAMHEEDRETAALDGHDDGLAHIWKREAFGQGMSAKGGRQEAAAAVEFGLRQRRNDSHSSTSTSTSSSSSSSSSGSSRALTMGGGSSSSTSTRGSSGSSSISSPATASSSSASSTAVSSSISASSSSASSTAVSSSESSSA